MAPLWKASWRRSLCLQRKHYFRLLVFHERYSFLCRCCLLPSLVLLSKDISFENWAVDTDSFECQRFQVFNTSLVMSRCFHFLSLFFYPIFCFYFVLCRFCFVPHCNSIACFQSLHFKHSRHRFPISSHFTLFLHILFLLFTLLFLFLFIVIVVDSKPGACSKLISLLNETN